MLISKVISSSDIPQVEERPTTSVIYEAPVVKNNRLPFILGAISVLVLLIGGFIGGCQYRKLIFKSPVTTTNTVTVHDTVSHYIPHYVPWVILGEDTIMHDTIPAKVDTLAILHDYYNKHIYHRTWENDTLKASITDTISRNKFIGSHFTYIIKTPFTTTNNYTDNKYIQFGLSMPVYKFTQDSIKLNALNKLALKLDYIFPKGSVGVSWQPQGNVIGIEFSATLIKFKQKK